MSNKKNARPWDLFNAKIGRVPENIQQERYNICKQCPRLNKITKQCKECGCFMPEKTKLPNAFCDIHKWNEWSIDE